MPRTREEVLAWMNSMPDIEPCAHCGRCVLCGPPCCQGMVDDIAKRQAEEDAKVLAEREVRRKAKRARAVARRAERRAEQAVALFAAMDASSNAAEARAVDAINLEASDAIYADDTKS